MRSAHRWVEHIVASLRRFKNGRCGNVAIIFALVTVPLVGAVGISVDYVKASQLRTRMQQALDAAVLAGVAESSSSLKISKATSFFQSQITNDWGTAPTASFSVDDAGKLIGMAQVAAKGLFVGMLGQSSISVKVTTAAVTTSVTTSKVCILLVDPTQSQSLLVNSGANLNAPNCEIHVRSTASPAAIFNSSTTLNVKKICIKGSNIIKNGGINPPAETGCAAISDPFSSSMPPVSVGACNYNNEVYPGSVTINPGVYCGWTNFNGSGTLTLNPGLYIIKNGGMTFNSGWTVTGNGVTFYLVDQNATITFNGNVNFKLSPPTSGSYANVLMFEPAGLANTNLPINGTSGSSLQGLLYLPSRDVTINSVSNVSADKVTMVFSSLIFNALNWTFDAGNIAMSVSTGSGGAPRLTQ